MGIDVSTESGSPLYRSALEALEVPQDRWVIPIVVIGDTVLIGGDQIAERLPDLVAEGLKAGGIDWPDVPGLVGAFDAADATLTAREAATVEAPSATEATPAPTPTPAPTVPATAPPEEMGPAAPTTASEALATPAPSAGGTTSSGWLLPVAVVAAGAAVVGALTVWRRQRG